MIKAHDAYKKSQDNLNNKMSAVMSAIEDIIIRSCESGYTSALIREDEIYTYAECADVRIINDVKDILIEYGYEVDMMTSYNELDIKISWDKSSNNSYEAQKSYESYVEKMNRIQEEFYRNVWGKL